jgi:hypothetical protein
MRRVRNPIRLAAVTLALLGCAPGASAATTLAYKGKTSQKRSISFTVSGGSVTELQFHIIDRCSAKRVLLVRDHGIPSMSISHSKFGATFHNHQGSTITIAGHINGKTVGGSLKDKTENDQTHKWCSGSASFSLKPS